MALQLRRTVIELPGPAANTTALQAPVKKQSRRNIAIDILRGYCIVMMIAGHTGSDTWVNNSIHMLRFVSGAEGFVFLSGLVLGMVYLRKLNAAPANIAYRALWKRAGLIWTVHCTLVVLAVALNTSVLHFSDIPNISTIGIPRFLWLTAILKFQPGHLLNILPMYVIFLTATPVALELMRKGKTAWFAAASVGTFVYCQFNPAFGQWVDPICGGDAFPVTAWQALFFSGMIIGFYHAPLKNMFLQPNRKLLMWSLGTACLALAIFVSVQSPSFQFYNHERWDLFLWERHPLRFGRVLYFLLAVSAFYLLVQKWWYSLPAFRAPLEVLAVLGRNSLYTFLLHLVIAFALDAVYISPNRQILLEMIPLASIATVYMMARYQVARPWIPN